MTALKLLCILSHPDDETLALGHVLAKYAREGVETYVISATRGQYGWYGDEADYPGAEALGALRERELRAACDVLGVHEVTVLDFVDGQLGDVPTHQIVPLLAEHIRRIRPQIILTFDPFGNYGHPDHIAICQLTLAAVCEAAAVPPDSPRGHGHHVDKVYFLAEPEHLTAQFEAIFGPISITVNGEERRTVIWPDWSITAEIDTSAYTGIVWRAIDCYPSQLGQMDFEQVPSHLKKKLYSKAYLYCALSRVGLTKGRETDLFAGLRGQNAAPVKSDTAPTG